MENFNISWSELIEARKNKTLKKSESLTEAIDAAEQVTRDIPGMHITGTTIPINSRTVTTASGLTQAKTLIERMRSHSVIHRLGAQSMTQLIYNINVGTEINRVNSAWVGEIMPAAENSPTWNGDLLTPRRLYSNVNISSSMMRLAGTQQFEEYVSDIIMRSHAEAFDAACIAGTGLANDPVGILSDPLITQLSLAPDGRALTFDDILTAEQTAAPNHYEAEHMKFAYLMNANVRRSLKRTPKNAGGDIPIMSGSWLNGHPAATSQHVPSNIALGGGANLSALIFGNFADTVTLQWGALDVLIDPFTNILNGEVRLHLSSFLNFKVLRPENFYTISGIVTT